MNNKEFVAKQKKLLKRANRLRANMRFWNCVSKITRFGIHGFVMWMIVRTIKKFEKFNRDVDSFNRELKRERKFRRRERAMSR